MEFKYFFTFTLLVQFQFWICSTTAFILEAPKYSYGKPPSITRQPIDLHRHMHTHAYQNGNDNYDVYGPSIIKFDHENCAKEVHQEMAGRKYHDIEPYFEPHHNTLDLFVRIRGQHNGYIFLTKEKHDLTGPLYWVIFGSYSNKYSEIRRSKDQQNIKVNISTPNIIDENIWRGFHVKYKQNIGEISIFLEGSGFPLMEWKDPNPLPIKYFSFGTYSKETIEIAFNCRAKDIYSTADAANVKITNPDKLLNDTALFEHVLNTEEYVNDGGVDYFSAGTITSAFVIVKKFDLILFLFVYLILYF